MLNILTLDIILAMTSFSGNKVQKQTNYSRFARGGVTRIWEIWEALLCVISRFFNLWSGTGVTCFSYLSFLLLTQLMKKKGHSDRTEIKNKTQIKFVKMLVAMLPPFIKMACRLKVHLYGSITHVHLRRKKRLHEVSLL